MTGSSEPAPASDPGEVPKTGRLLGLDFGTRRIGVAVSTESQSIASPLENYTRVNEQLDEVWLREVAQEQRAAGLVVGLPLHMSGDEGGKAREARAFGDWAGSVTGLPVTFWDERFTTAAADLALMSTGLSAAKRKARLDMLSAQIMLQAYLDAEVQ